MRISIILLLCLQLINLSGLSFKPRVNSEDPKSSNLNQVFEELEDEAKLANYFMNVNQRRICQQLQDEERSHYIARFWQSYDPNPITGKNEFLEQIQLRIQYADTGLRGARLGWKSDMGRIHVKYGEPYEILSGEISGGNEIDSAEYNKYKGHEYQIWKYRLESGQDETFIFLELQTFGDKRLIYSESDSEVSFANWREYFGSMDINKLIGGFYE